MKKISLNDGLVICKTDDTKSNQELVFLDLHTGDHMDVEQEEKGSSVANGSIYVGPYPGSYRSSSNISLETENFQSLSKVFDSHCHLDRIFHRWKRQRSWKPLSTLAKYFPTAFSENFLGCISVVCDPRDWKRSSWLWLMNEENVFLTFGCHPKLSCHYDEESERLLENALKHPKTVALGEIGLDTTCNISLETQKFVFKRQLKLAKNLRLPVCLHTRTSAYGDPKEIAKITQQLLKSVLERDWPIHLHCFTETWDLAKEYMQSWPGMKFGITPGYVHKQDFIKNVPIDKILLETDAPYFLADTRKYEYNFSLPPFVVESAIKIASVKKVDVQEVLDAAWRNVQEVYPGIRRSDID